MTIEIYFSFVAAAVLLIIVPGPTVLTILSSSFTHGTRKSVFTIIGAASAHLFYITITALGVNKLLLMSVKYFIILKWVGVGYIVYLGIRLLVSVDNQGQVTKSVDNDNKEKKSIFSLFFHGFIVTLSNPKAVIFYAAFFPPFLNFNLPIIPQYLILGSTFILLFFILSFISALLAHRLLGFLIKEDRKDIINKISGGLMVAAGLFLASMKKP